MGFHATNPEPGPVLQEATEAGRTLVDELLAEQGRMTAVETLARKLPQPGEKPFGQRAPSEPVPLSRPREGEQYAFRVNLDACSACKACVTACHTLNGLDPGEAWRTVGTLRGGLATPFQATVTSACHHCLEPACLQGCPVLAYEKDPVTGIVRHLDDQCIGCQYCVLQCPYEVPKFHAELGIVRKCDLCQDRLADDLAPACVQACPNGALEVTVVSREAIRSGIRNGETLVPDAPLSRLTLPTTVYHSERGLPADLRALDAGELRPAPAHAPLAGMLVLTQMAAGLATWNAVMPAGVLQHQTVSLFATGILAAALGISTAHLGRPLSAWKAFLGWRTSWLSREILVFGGFFNCLAATVFFPGNDFLSLALRGVAALHGLAGVYCSVRIYQDTGREAWRWRITGPLFLGSTLLLAAGGLLWLGLGLPSSAGLHPAAAGVLLVLGWLFKRWGETARATSLDRQVRRLETQVPGGWLSLLHVARCAAVWLAIVACAAHRSGLIPAGQGLGALALVALVLGELFERHLYFVACVNPRMPGGGPR